MINDEVRADMRRLVLRDGWKIETVARHFGVHHSTVRRAIEEDGKDKSFPSTVLEPFKPYIIKRLSEHPDLSGVRLYEELRDRGYTHGIAVVRRYAAKVRKPRSRKAYLRVETAPGEQAQVDWGSFGQMRVGNTQRPLSCFAMVLSWSRALYVDFSLDQKMETFLRMHRRALEFFVGVPRQVLYDNLKSVVVSRVGSTIQFNAHFLSFAGHYLFEPAACPPRYPEGKGRVESAIRYVRSSFFYGRSFRSLSDVRQQAAIWRDQVANQRLHASTRERPAERLLVERPRLHALPEHPFDTDLIVPLIVNKEMRVRFDTNTYSVPPEYVGKSVQLRIDDERVRIMCEGDEIARHKRCYDRRRVIEDRSHIDKLLERRKGAHVPKRRERLENLGPAAKLYLQEVARRRIGLENEIKRLMRLLNLYSEQELADGMARAMAQGNLGARYVRALIDQARFEQGLGEPPEPIVTGNKAADDLVVEPHDLGSYDALFEKEQTEQDPQPDSEQAERKPDRDRSERG
jgi:transposase